MNYQSYIDMRARGSSLEDVYFQAKEDGLSHLEQLSVLKKVFGISATEAKETSIRLDDLANSLDEYQKKIYDQLSGQDDLTI